jgi:threonine/homoserine/homoserine lactone efflux protein
LPGPEEAELRARLERLEAEQLALREGFKAARMAIVGAIVTTVLAFAAVLITGASFISGTHLVIIVAIIAAALIGYFSFVFGRSVRIRGEISKVKGELETGPKVN